MPRIVTPTLIKSYIPCGTADYFYNNFPNGTEITIELCVEHASRIDWDWAKRLLSKTKRAQYEASVNALYAHHRKLMDNYEHPAFSPTLREEYATINKSISALQSELAKAKAAREPNKVYIDAMVAASTAFQNSGEASGPALEAYYDALTAAVENIASGGAERKRLEEEIRAKRKEAQRVADAMRTEMLQINEGYGYHDVDTHMIHIVQATEFALAWLTETDQEWIAKLDAKSTPRVRVKKAVAA